MQVGLGFLLLFGLATRAAALVGLLAYPGTLGVEPELLLANEYVTGMVAIAVVGSGRPSADHVPKTVASTEGTLHGEFDPVHRAAARLGRRFDPYQPFVATVVRVGLGLNFAYLGLMGKLLAPGPALAVVEKYDLAAVVPVSEGLWVVGAGLTEFGLGLGLAVGLFTRRARWSRSGCSRPRCSVSPTTVLAHVTLFGLASALVITGSGPLALDRRLGGGTGAGAGVEPATGSTAETGSASGGGSESTGD
ncbi:hypothetical protein BRC93_03445 [Halobacteriales archaeon QS_5_70_15]|nr:MAG: hypothetical protein BRC93_03445 [Halobacteriales archaeon QS_5_70_15]